MRQDERTLALLKIVHWAAAARRSDARTRWPRGLRWLAGPWQWSRAGRMLRQAIPAWRRASPEIARRDGVGRVSQLWHLCRLMIHYPLTPKEFYQFRFYDPARRAHASHYIFRLWSIDVLRRLEPAHASNWPKLDFRRACRERGLASIPVLGTFRDGALALEEGPGPDAGGWTGDLYVKPDTGAMGRGVELWPAGPAAALVERYRQLATREAFIVQPRIHNHPDLGPISNGNISALRITTCRTPEGGVEILLPLLQMSRGRTVTSHMMFGNVGAPIDPETGRLGRAYSYDARFIVSRHDVHPDTGARIPGREVPFWREAFELCRRAHRSFEGLVAVGWDVAITADGPVLIEGNLIFNTPIIQLVWDTPLGDTAYPAVLWAQVEQRGFAPVSA